MNFKGHLERVGVYTAALSPGEIWDHYHQAFRIFGFSFFASPGWLGVRRGRRYLYLRDVARHRLLYSERNRHGCTRLAALGSWELWTRR